MSPDTGGKKSRQHAHSSASGRRRWPGPHHDHSSGLAREPGSPHARATGACLPPTDSTLPRGPAGANRRSGDPRGLAGNGRRQPPARPRAPEGQPGALQEHHRRPGETRSRAQGEARGAPAGRPQPHRGEGGPLATHSQGAGGEGPPRQKAARHAGCRQAGGRSARPGRGPHPFPSTHRDGVQERRGARGRSEKSGPIRQECPSLVRRGLGPAQESTMSPHRSA